jgi:hypothetical protein
MFNNSDPKCNSGYILNIKHAEPIIHVNEMLSWRKLKSNFPKITAIMFIPEVKIQQSC